MLGAETTAMNSQVSCPHWQVHDDKQYSSNLLQMPGNIKYGAVLEDEGSCFRLGD